MDKVKLYERAGVPDYLIVELPRRGTDGRFRLLGFCLGPFCADPHRLASISRAFLAKRSGSRSSLSVIP